MSYSILPLQPLIKDASIQNFVLAMAILLNGRVHLRLLNCKHDSGFCRGEGCWVAGLGAFMVARGVGLGLQILLKPLPYMPQSLLAQQRMPAA